MKIHIFRHVTPADIEIGDVVLWENDNPIEVESITRTKDGYELTGHNRYKPGLRAITMRPNAEQLRVMPNKREAELLVGEIEKALTDSQPPRWTVELVNDLKPLVIRGKAPTVTTSANATVDAP